MPALDNLPPDQRAVLQMVLQRGRTYDEIAGLLSIDRAAVRQRALDALDALAPAAVLPGPESALVTDYLLGQLPEKVAEQVYAYLQASDADRAWAQELVAILAPVGPLPEIPAGAPLGADDWSAGGLEQGGDPIQPAAPQPDEAYGSTDSEAADATEEWSESAVADPAPAAPAPWPSAESSAGSGGTRTRATPGPRPSSRRGGAILLGSVAALIVAVILVVVLTSSGGGPKHSGSGLPAATATTSQNASTTVTTTTGTTTTAAAPTLLAQLNLKSPTGVSSTLGVAQVIREQGITGIVILAQGIPANTSHNAYAVWLYNSAGSFKFVGFVRNLVTKTGKLSAEGQLPPGAAAYHRLLITLETQQKPSAPGEVVLSGPFREHP
jgi:hypothetical protein